MASRDDKKLLDMKRVEILTPGDGLCLIHAIVMQLEDSTFTCESLVEMVLAQAVGGADRYLCLIGLTKTQLLMELKLCKEKKKNFIDYGIEVILSINTK